MSMILQHVTADSVALKTSSGTVQIKHDGHIRIQDKELEGPGEYDVAGIGVHVFSEHAVLFAEGLRLAIVWGSSPEFQTEDETSIESFLFLQPDVKLVNNVIKEHDPRLIIVHDEAVAAELAKQDSVSIQKEGSYKVTAQSLPAEERVFLLLA